MPDRDTCRDEFRRCVIEAQFENIEHAPAVSAGDFYGPVRPALPTVDYVTPSATPTRRKRRKRKLPKGCHCPKGAKTTGYGGCFKMKRSKTRKGKQPVAVKMVCR